MQGLTMEEYFAERPVSDEIMEQARRDTDEYIRAYELRKVREAHGMTQCDVAKAMGVGQNRVSAVENGRLDSLRLDTLVRYAKALGGTVQLTVNLPEGAFRLS